MSLTDYVIMPGADYKDACDAVREKTGGTELIKSGEMGAQIRAIQGGFAYKNTMITEIPKNAFRKANGGLSGYTLTEVDCESATTVGDYAFHSCEKLRTVNLPAATSIGNKCFLYGYELENANLPLLETIKTSAFAYCKKLPSLVFPSVTSVADYAFDTCESLTRVDFGASVTFGMAVFSECTSLNAIIFRSTEGVCVATPQTLAGSPLLTGTAFIYIHASMWDAYTAAYGDYMVLFRKIEDYPEICG